MKKIFTLAAAVLASFSLWAQAPAVSLTAASSKIEDWNATYNNVTISVQGAGFASKKPCGASANENAMSLSSSDSQWIEISCPDGLSRIVVTGSGNSSGTTDWAAPLCACAAAPFDSTVISIIEVHYTGYDKECVENDITLPEGTKSVRLYRRMKVNSEKTAVGSGSNWAPESATGNQTFNITYLEAYAGAAVPSTDPVKTVTLSGPEACYVGKVASYAATTDVKANAYKWTVNGAEQEGATAAKFDYTPATAGNYAIVCLAKNDNNTDYVASNTITLVATEKPAATPCAELYPAATGDTPAQGAKAALTDASYGGDIIFAGAKNNDFAAAFKYTEYGLQMCTGGADSVRVELGHNIAVGTVIELRISVAGMADAKTRGFNLLTVGGKSVLAATWTPVETEGDTVAYKVFTYEVTDKDGLAGQNAFRLQRSNSAILEAVLVSDCGEEITPDTDPVVEATVAGPTEAYVNQTVQLTCTAAKADKYQWYDANGAIEGATAAKYSFVPAAAGSYSFYCTAANEYTATPVQSNTLVITVTEKQTLAQVDVTGDITWDWEKAATVNEIRFTDTTTPVKNERVLLANVEGMNNNADFNSQALLFEGEYAMRVQGNFKLCQGQLLQFHTTVAGYLTVTYSNTGSRTAGEGEIEGQEAERRFLTVNGAQVAGDKGSMKSGETTLVANIPVNAGDVAISGVKPYRTDGKDATAAEYIRIMKVQFSTQAITTGINNVEESVKAVKVIRDGKLFIKKNGVLYNAQGVIVK